MGYCSHYQLQIVGGISDDLNDDLMDPAGGECGAFESLLGYGVDDLKWYNQDDDMLALSARHPTVRFVLTRTGEDRDDHVRTHYVGGQRHVCKGRVVYESFDPEKLL